MLPIGSFSRARGLILLSVPAEGAGKSETPIVTGDAAEASSAIVAANAAVNNNFTD